VSTDKKPVADETPEPWVWMRRTGDDVPEDAEPVRFPNDPAVIEHHQARRWELVDAPAEAPFVQRPSDLPDPDEAPWVDLVHPGLDGRRHSFNNDPAALQGAYDAGWELPPAEQDEQPKDQPAEKPAKRTSKQASAKPADDQEG
jgi:hypothetical protein